VTQECTISDAVLKASPYNLSRGDMIVARVSFTYPNYLVNYSPNTFGAQLGNTPDKVDELFFIGGSRGGLDIDWFPMESLTGTIMYQVQMMNSGADWVDVTEPRVSPRTSIMDLTYGEEYSFKVRAKNDCGWGEYSDAYDFKIVDKPE
jgi:hypothetical protein